MTSHGNVTCERHVTVLLPSGRETTTFQLDYTNRLNGHLIDTIHSWLQLYSNYSAMELDWIGLDLDLDQLERIHRCVSRDGSAPGLWCQDDIWRQFQKRNQLDGAVQLLWKMSNNYYPPPWPPEIELRKRLAGFIAISFRRLSLLSRLCNQSDSFFVAAFIVLRWSWFFQRNSLKQPNEWF